MEVSFSACHLVVNLWVSMFVLPMTECLQEQQEAVAGPAPSVCSHLSFHRPAFAIDPSCTGFALEA